MNAEEFLAAARGFQMMEPATEGQRRSAALMARTAVESALRDYWKATYPALNACRHSTQMVCLGTLSTPEKARPVDSAWRTLSDLIHYRPYQITPLASEIDNAITLAEQAVAGLRKL